MTYAYLSDDCARKLTSSHGGRRALNPLIVKVPLVLIKRHNLSTSTITINNHLKALGV